mmetsp:Transcript_10769/g.31572  ORF Transcript_10769/g.31572 Transcript_10769/m.31572 type:complete len:209 (+) Transcript_10769:226-852(+)
MLELCDLHAVEVERGRLGQVEGVEVLATGVKVTNLELGERGGSESCAVCLRQSHEDDGSSQNVVELGEAAALGGERDHLSRENNSGAVLRGAHGSGLEPVNTGSDLSAPCSSASQHGPSSVHEFNLSGLGDLLIGLVVSPVGPEGLIVVSGVSGCSGLDVKLLRSGLGDNGTGLGDDGLLSSNDLRKGTHSGGRGKSHSHFDKIKFIR